MFSSQLHSFRHRNEKKRHTKQIQKTSEKNKNESEWQQQTNNKNIHKIWIKWEKEKRKPEKKNINDNWTKCAKHKQRIQRSIFILLQIWDENNKMLYGKDVNFDMVHTLRVYVSIILIDSIQGGPRLTGKIASKHPIEMLLIRFLVHFQTPRLSYENKWW